MHKQTKTVDPFAWADRVIGTCSICGGAVVMPTYYWSTVPPMPQCIRCGGVPRERYGRVIQMEGALSPFEEEIEVNEGSSEDMEITGFHALKGG